MYPLLMLVVGAVLLGVLLLKVPLRIPLKQRMQAVCISSLLVLLTLLLSMLYTWQTATFAFIGLFLLFVVVFSKQFEYQRQEKVSDQPYGVEPFVAATAYEPNTKEHDFRDELSTETVEFEEPIDEMIEERMGEADHSEVIEQEGFADIEIKEKVIQPENEEELLDYFQSRPKNILQDDLKDDTEESGFSRLRMNREVDNDEVHEELPVRIPSQVDWEEEDKVVEEHHRSKAHERERQIEPPPAVEEIEDVITFRKRLFEELEIDDKKD